MKFRHSAGNKQVFEKYIKNRFKNYKINNIKVIKDAKPSFPGIYEADISNDNKIKVVFYKWGEYVETMEVDLKDLKNMVTLTSDDLLGFDLRLEDENKYFYAEENDIEYSEDEGTGVKRAYGTNKNIEEL